MESSYLAGANGNTEGGWAGLLVSFRTRACSLQFLIIILIFTLLSIASHSMGSCSCESWEVKAFGRREPRSWRLLNAGSDTDS
jgi:hypothetical protein